MKRLLLVIFTLVLGLSVVMAGGPPKAKRGVLGNEVVSHAASHFAFPPFFGDGSNAGAEVCATGQIEGLGNSTVCASASWDWSGYSGGQNALLYPR